MDPLDAIELRASLAGSVERNVLNYIQAEIVRRLKKA